jgi:HEAT repeat protein
MTQKDTQDGEAREKTGLKIYNFESLDDSLRALDDDEPETRIKAIESLARFFDFFDFSLIANLARKESDFSVRKAAIKALGASGKKEAFEPLLETLLENVSELQEPAVMALYQLSDPRALYFFKKIQQETESRELKETLAGILRKMEEGVSTPSMHADSLKEAMGEGDDWEYLEILLGSPESVEDARLLRFLRDAITKNDPESIRRLQSLMAECDEKTRHNIVRAYSFLPVSEELKEGLFHALQDSSDPVRLEALHILLKSKDKNLSTQLFPFLGDTNPIISLEISKFLQDNSTPQILQMASDALESQNDLLRIRAASLLAKSDKESVMPYLLNILQENNSSPELLTEIINSLKPKRSQYIVRTLPALLKKGNKQILKQLSLYIRKVDDADIYTVLRKNLTHGDPRIRQGCAFLVGQAQDRSSLENLIRLLHDPFDSIKIQSGWSLAHMKAETAFEHILEAFKESKDRRVRKGFLEILARLDMERALSILMEAFRDEDSEIRFHAVQILGLYAGPSKDMVLKALQGMLRDRNHEVIFMAIDSLISLGVESFALPADEIVSVIKEFLKDKKQEPSLRATAIKNIVHLEKEKSFDFLMESIKSEHESEVLSAIIEAIGSFNDFSAFSALLELLESDLAYMKKKAAHVLCQKDDERCIFPLLKLLEKSYRTEANKFDVTLFLIIEHLNKLLKNPLKTNEEHTLLRLLKHRALPVRHMAAFHLAYGGGEKINEPFSRFLKSPSFFLHYIGALGLGRFNDTRAVQKLVDIIQDRELSSIRDVREKIKIKKELYKYYSLLPKFDELEEDFGEPDISKKMLALYFLGKMIHPLVFPSLKNAALSTDSRLSEVAVKALAELQDSSVVPFFLELKENRTDFTIQTAIDPTLRRFKEDAKAHLAQYVKSPQHDKRSFAARTIADIKGLATPQELITSLSDEHWLVRYWTVTALAMMPDKGSELFEALKDKLKDTSPLVRAGALYALMSIQEANHKELLTEALNDAHFFVRTEATKITGGLRLKDLEQTLLHHLNDESFAVRAAAARALGDMGAVNAVLALKEIKYKRETQEKIWALYSLQLLSGEKNVPAIAAFLVEPAEDRPEDILSFKMGKMTQVKYYAGIFKKMGEIGYKAAPFLFREEFEEVKKGHHEFLLRFLKNLDKIYAEKISQARENQFNAIEALGAVGRPESLLPLREVLQSRREKAVKLAVLRALAPHRNQEAYKALIPGLADPSIEVYTKTAQMLKKAEHTFLKRELEILFRECDIPSIQKGRILRILPLP